MTPSSATPHRRRTSRSPRRRRPRNAAASASVKGSTVSARALAAGLWRLRHAERMMAAGASQPHQKVKKGRSRRRPATASHLLCYGNKPHHHHLAAGTGSHCRCRCNRSGGILDKIDACVECPLAFGSSSMEKATKWDAASHLPLPPSPLLLLNLKMVMSAELEKARSELEEERRVTTRRLHRFLRRLAAAADDSKSRRRLRDERAHRRQLEQANGRLLRELAAARAAARQQARRHEAERAARELMEDACSELTREVEEDQAEVELLRRECLRLREEMEEERRMLQVAEVWREERVQMKLADARLALEAKYAHLHRLQAEMEAFLSSSRRRNAHGAASHSHSHSHSHSAAAAVSKERERHIPVYRSSSSSSSPASSKSKSKSNDDMLHAVSPATDLFLAKAAGGSSGDDDLEIEDSCSWVGTTTSGDRSRSASLANGNGGGGVTTGASRRSTKDTALIRRLWRSAITESRNKTGRTTAADDGGACWSPSYSAADDRGRRSSVTAETPHLPPPPAVAGADQCSSSGGSGLPLPPVKQKQKQSLKEKLMEARMDDHRPGLRIHAHAAKQKP